MKLRSARAAVAIVAALAVTAGFSALAVVSVDLDEVSRGLAATGPGAWLACLGSMAAASLFRFARLAAAFDAAPVRLFNVSALHNAAGAFFPGRLGELVFPVLMKRAAAESLLAGAGFLLLMRALDALCVALLLGAGFAFLAAGPAGAGAAALGGLGVLALAAFGLSWCLGLVVQLAPAFARPAFERLTAVARRLPRARAAAVVASTAGVWVALAAGAAAAIRGVDAGGGFAEAALAVGASTIAFASPVNGVASAGPFEAAFAGALVSTGAAPAPALAAAVVMHLSALASALACVALAQAMTFAGRSAAGDRPTELAT